MQCASTVEVFLPMRTADVLLRSLSRLKAERWIRPGHSRIEGRGRDGGGSGKLRRLGATPYPATMLALQLTPKAPRRGGRGRYPRIPQERALACCSCMVQGRLWGRVAIWIRLLEPAASWSGRWPHVRRPSRRGAGSYRYSREERRPLVVSGLAEIAVRNRQLG